LHVSTERNLSHATAADPAASAIENEIPAYRAVAPGAVFALILGLIAVLSFASLYFVAVAALAVVVGFLADRKIQRFPKELTGRGLAQAGVGLGLIFGLTALSIDGAQGFVRGRQATAFARTFEQVLQKGTFEQVIWWGQSPLGRKNETPEKLVADMTEKPQNAQMFETRYASVRELKKRLNVPGATVHFEGLEEHGLDGLNPYAAALYEVHNPSPSKPEEAEQYARAFIKGMTNDKGQLEWWVETLAFPAKPGTFQAPTPKADDGHGHAH
jgi:hypothetical protein